MSKIFKCHHCHKWHKKNPRLKEVQKYCGSRECQQERKNTWERDRLKNDSTYKSKRQTDKKRWYLKYPGDKYQSEYRKSHSKYFEENQEKQVSRNENRKITTTAQKIVKTDALTSESIVAQELYVLIPYKKAVEKTDAKMIVKTDSLIVQILAASGLGNNFLPDSS